jgi:hypothetical protein
MSCLSTKERGSDGFGVALFHDGCAARQLRMRMIDMLGIYYFTQKTEKKVSHTPNYFLLLLFKLGILLILIVKLTNNDATFIQLLWKKTLAKTHFSVVSWGISCERMTFFSLTFFSSHEMSCLQLISSFLHLK